jgi:predicted alpha/beta-hydrolase family hydrolase
VEDLKDSLSSYFETVTTQHYRHWQNGEEWADVEYEITVAKEKVRDLSPYIIIGKSIGTAIAARGVAEGVLHPEKIILLGVPIKGGVPAKSLIEWLKQITIPVVIVQNTADPLGSFVEVKSSLENTNNNLSFVELAGETHDYVDFEAIARLI